VLLALTMANKDPGVSWTKWVRNGARILVVACCFASPAFAADSDGSTNPASRRARHETRFASESDVATWTRWSPRDEIAPAFSFDSRGGRDGKGALKITARALSDFGAWRKTFAGFRGGQTYRFTAWYRTEQIENARRSVIARLEWLDATGKPVRFSVRPPEFPLDVAREGDWVKMESVVRVPDPAVGLDVQLSLGFSSKGAVWWDAVSLTEIDPPAARVIRAMTVLLRPRNSPSAQASVEQFCAAVQKAADQKPDIICLPEGITVVGTKHTYAEVSESIPGPTTERLGALAKSLNSYVVAGIYERAAPAVYNTAVLIDRTGKVVGRYRKTHLPREEWEGGLTPGESYPIFEADFGKIGLMVCWDIQFPEPWRALGLQGAELILLPIWGGSETLLRARAIENHAFVVSSSYDMKSCVVAPDGEILIEATKASPVVTTEVHLDRKIYQPWLGDMSTRTWKERRGDLPR
jgi:predicted amidohydrolase